MKRVHAVDADGRNRTYSGRRKIIRITPIGAEGNRATGIGVQFSEQDEGTARNKIEALSGWRP